MKATIDGEEVELKEKIFKSGSRGFWANGQIARNSKIYYFQICLTEKGSKPKGTEGKNDTNQY